MDRNIFILHASETGNSQDLAQLLAARLRRLTLTTHNTPADAAFPPIANIVVSSLDDALPTLVALLNTHLETPNPANTSAPFNLLFPLISTTGQGELPRSAHRFWKFFLRRSLPPSLFARFQMSTFGLGDSSYPRYNWAVRKVHARLLQLGAREIGGASGVPRAEADEQSADPVPDKVYQEWEDRIVKFLEASDLFQDPETGVGLLNVIPDDVLLPPVYPLKLSDDDTPVPDSTTPRDILTTAETRVTETSSSTAPALATVSSITRITSPAHFQDVRHIALALPPGFHYLPGDTLALYPANAPDDVQALLDHMGWAPHADRRVEVTPQFAARASGGAALVQPLTLRNLLTHHLDISCVPRRSFFAGIWRFSQPPETEDTQSPTPASSASADPGDTSGKTDPNTAEHAVREREKLKAFGADVDDDTLEDLYNYANRPRRSVLETLVEFGSLGRARDGTPRVPLTYVADVLPVLRPRLFSIASCDAADSEEKVTAELCVAVVKYKTVLRRTRRGVCSRWLEECVAPAAAAAEEDSAEAPPRVMVSLQRNHLFRSAPRELATGAAPVLLVAAGTGVAPIRSLVAYYIQQHEKHSAVLPEMHVFFGCRTRGADFHYNTEWARWLRDPVVGPRLHLHAAFSRPVPGAPPSAPLGPNYDELEGVHLQAQLQRHAARVAALLRRQHALVYLCGASGKFPTETRAAFVTVLAETWRDVSPEEEEEEDVEAAAAAYVHEMEQKGRFIQETW